MYHYVQYTDDSSGKETLCNDKHYPEKCLYSFPAKVFQMDALSADNALTQVGNKQ